MKAPPAPVFLQKRAFTLVELLVSMVIVVLLLLILVSITDQTRRTWTYTTSKVEQFRDSREAFESITRRISQATLNTYWDYHYPNDDTSKPPDSYVRQSELRFISGSANTLTVATNRPTHAVFFQAPLGFVQDTTTYAGINQLENLLNTWGYYLEWNSDKTSRPAFLPASFPEHYRFRLMEMMEPSEKLTVYQYTSGLTGTTAKNLTYKGKEWFTTPLAVAPQPGGVSQQRVVADNVIALIILPKLSQSDQKAKDPITGISSNYTDSSLAPSYDYDTTYDKQSDPNLNPHNQLPPEVLVTMVAVDEATFGRLQGSSATMPDYTKDLFQKAGNLSDSSVDGYAKDLAALQTTLQTNHLNYRIFSTTVSLKAAKWSRSQKK